MKRDGQNASNIIHQVYCRSLLYHFTQIFPQTFYSDVLMPDEESAIFQSVGINSLLLVLRNTPNIH